MNCLLVLPRTAHKEWIGAITPGISYISAVLKRVDGFTVTHLNLNSLKAPEDPCSILSTLIKENKIQTVWSGGYYPNYASMRRVFETAKGVDPKIITVAGGPIITGDPIPAMTALGFADYGMIGEGERTAKELALALSGGASTAQIRAIDGLIIQHEGGYQLTSPRQVITDWGEIPWADYESFGYTREYFHQVRTGNKDAWSGPAAKMPITASRGCPFSCTFCGNSHGPLYRQRPLPDFFAEMRHRLDSYDRFNISVADELLATSKTRLREFCRGMKKLGMKKNWTASLRVPDIDEEVVDLLREAGCGLVSLGLESASNKILRSMNKKITIEQTEKVLAIIKRADLPFMGNFIFGDVEEDYETAQETLTWWKAHPEYWASINLWPIIFYPGTALYKKALAMGKIKDPVEHLVAGVPIINISKMDDAQFSALQLEIDRLLRRASNDKNQQPQEMELSFDYTQFMRKVSARCHSCGQVMLDIEVDWHRSCLVCPACNRRYLVPMGDSLLELDKNMISQNLRALLKKHQRVVFWGIGEYFKNHVDSDALTWPGVELIDGRRKGAYGGRHIVAPESLARSRVPIIVNSVFPQGANSAYQKILSEAREKFPETRIVSLYNLANPTFAA